MGRALRTLGQGVMRADPQGMAIASRVMLKIHAQWVEAIKHDSNLHDSLSAYVLHDLAPAWDVRKVMAQEKLKVSIALPLCTCSVALWN